MVVGGGMLDRRCESPTLLRRLGVSELWPRLFSLMLLLLLLPDIRGAMDMRCFLLRVVVEGCLELEGPSRPAPARDTRRLEDIPPRVVLREFTISYCWKLKLVSLLV